MTWRWLIFSSASLWLALPAAALAASVNGEVELTNSKDAAVRKRKDYSGVVLWLEAVDRAGDRAGDRAVDIWQLLYRN